MNASSMCANCFGFLTPEGYCKKCRRISEAAPLQKEKKAKTELNDESTSAPSASSRNLAQGPDSKLIAAVNRATHAIRSLALFIFTTLCTSLLGYGLIGAGAAAALRCNSHYSDCGSGFVIWGWIIIALGFIVGLGIGINELGKSKP